MRARLIAWIGAVLSAYAATAALVLHFPVLVAPMAASFIACLFVASMLDECFDESVEQKGDVLHAPSLFSLAQTGRTTALNKVAELE